MAEVPVTLALGHYDRHMPFFDGTIAIDGVALTLINVDSVERHNRMLNDGAYDVAELSLSSYLVARDRGLPFTAVPVFPRRLFSQSNMYRNLGAGIESPQDLVGRRVGLSSYQTTLCVLAKGDLHHEYGVPWKEIRWVVGREQAVEADLPADLKLDVVPRGANLSDMLAQGDIAALLVSRTPRCFLDRDARVARLFSQPRDEEAAYFRRNGFFPIMHVLTFKDETLREHPWLGAAFLDAFNRALIECGRHWEDPNWSRLAWGQQYLDEEIALMGRDPWANGVKANRANIERFVEYSHEQGLISRRLRLEELFAPPTLET